MLYDRISQTMAEEGRKDKRIGAKYFRKSKEMNV